MHVDSCSSNIKWASMHATTWGPIGEDLFAQKCMDKHGVSKIQNFDLTTDGVCPGVKKKWGHEKDTKAFKPDCDKVSTPVMHPFKTSQAPCLKLELTADRAISSFAGDNACSTHDVS